ncbi:conserved exported protein of unknown function (plasmid) [Rhodovastum atsumiense]|uniref:P-type conjugative transfer protein TrbJ n=1 Tax=Rhodovastum atsumiense TaxID=504468 RepID=A0A5M6IQ35_9PROT|nr:type IV secretion system protein [Rhodovastum atsumiense]KAA5609595.1 hypothetical protein F1189_23510 [Rhodovastum atsumiense]CAH2606361.1 conserved exported protein of unknown function [Rhodovastum atsumiense]
MKKSALLAAALTASLGLGSPAQAQSVFCINCADQPTQALGWQMQGLNMANQINQLVAEYRLLTQVWNSLAHVTNIGDIAYAMGGVAHSFLPPAGALPSLLGGAGPLFGAAPAFLQENRLADVGAASPWAQAMQQRELTTANVQALAQAALEDAQARIAALTAAEAAIAASGDVTSNGALGNVVALAQLNLAAHKLQLDQMQTMLAAAGRVEQQRAEQAQWQSARQMLENSRPVTEEFR